MSEYTQGIYDNGSAILKDGHRMSIEEILLELRKEKASFGVGEERILSFQYIEAGLKNEFLNYEIDLKLYQSGGVLLVTGCDHCGSDPDIFESAIWRRDKGETMQVAFEKLKGKIE